MIKRFINWYITKYWKDEFFHKDDLKDAFNDVRQDERGQQEEIWGERMENQRIEFERKAHLEKVRSDDQIASLTKRLKEAQAVVRQANSLHFNALTGAQGNLQIAARMAVKVNALRDMIADLTGSLAEIETDAHAELKALQEARK